MSIYESNLPSAKILQHLFKESFGGPKDTIGMASLMAAAAATSPAIYSSAQGGWLIPAATFLAATAGSLLLSDTVMAAWKDHFIFKSSVDVESSAPPIKPFEKPGLCFGYCTDTGKPLYIPDDDLFRHVWVVGQSGMGKTVAASFVMTQQIQRGGGVLFVDGKLDIDNISTMYHQCVWAGRGQDFFVLNPGEPALSNTYNPILYGDADEVASRLLSMIPSTESNAGSDFYKQSANEALVVIIGAFKRCGMKYDFYDLAVVMNNGKAMEYLLGRLKKEDANSSEWRNLALFLDRYRVPANDTRNPLAGQLDMKRLKEILGGMSGRLFTFGTGNFGKILNDYDPDVVLYDVIKSEKIIYAALPTMGKDIAANNFGKMLLGDFRTAVSWLQRNKKDRPKTPFMCFFDEASSYVTESWAVVFEQARSAGIFLMPAIQTESGFSAISEDFSERVIGNNTTKIFFRVGTTKMSEMAADLIGQTHRTTTTETSGSSSSESNSNVQIGPQKNVGGGENLGTSSKEEEQYLITPDQLRSLDKGEAIVLYSGSNVYDIRIPMVGLDESGTNISMGELQLNYRRKNHRPRGLCGLDMMNRVGDYLQGERVGGADGKAKAKSKGKSGEISSAEVASVLYIDLDEAHEFLA